LIRIHMGLTTPPVGFERGEVAELDGELILPSLFLRVVVLGPMHFSLRTLTLFPFLCPMELPRRRSAAREPPARA
jgi:hypothetical protein